MLERKNRVRRVFPSSTELPMILPARSMLAPDGPVARRLAGFEARPQQLEMATAVEDALAAKERLFVEAGTGTGKSFEVVES